jgi:hypothetical protein
MLPGRNLIKYLIKILLPSSGYEAGSKAEELSKQEA